GRRGAAQPDRRAVAPRRRPARAREDPRRQRAARARRGPRLGKARAVTAWHTRARNELEVALGAVQLRALERAISLAANVRADRTPDGVAYFARPPPVGRAVIRYVVTQRVRRADALHRLFRGFILADGDAGVPSDVAQIRCPALVIHGEQDRIIDKRTALDLSQALPRAELVVM